MAKIDIAKEIKKLSKEERAKKVKSVTPVSSVIDLTSEAVLAMVPMMIDGKSDLDIKKAVRLQNGVVGDKGYGFTFDQIKEVRAELEKIQAEDAKSEV